MTVYNIFKSGKLPVDSYQMDKGTIIVNESKNTKTEKYVIYSCVSFRDQKRSVMDVING